MLSILDRYLLRSLIVNYVIAVAVMLSLYVVLDMFVNMDEFTEAGYPALTVLSNIVDYYAANLLLYYSQLSGVITLFACAAVLARMRKLNELTAILASGVSLYRVARPVFIFAVVITGVLIVDTELLIPRVAHKLARDHDDADGKRAYEVWFLRDRDGASLSAGKFRPTHRDSQGQDEPILERLLVLFRDENGAVVRTLEADRATWQPPTDVRPTGRWKLERGKLMTRRIRQAGTLGPREDISISEPLYYESDLSPEAIQVRQSSGWIKFLSLSQLRDLELSGTVSPQTIAKTRHSKFVTPLVSLLLLLLGLPFFLDRSPADVVRDAGRCMLVCGLCYVVAFIGQSINAGGASALPAWIPIFVFGPVGVVLLDRVRT